MSAVEPQDLVFVLANAHPDIPFITAARMSAALQAAGYRLVKDQRAALPTRTQLRHAYEVAAIDPSPTFDERA